MAECFRFTTRQIPGLVPGCDLPPVSALPPDDSPTIRQRLMNQVLVYLGAAQVAMLLRDRALNPCGTTLKLIRDKGYD